MKSSELLDDKQYPVHYPRCKCNIPLVFKGCTIKLFPLKNKKIDWDTTWDMRWKSVMKDGVRRWKDGSCPFKSVKRSLERHYRRYHVGKILPSCVSGTIFLLVHSDSSNESESSESESD